MIISIDIGTSKLCVLAYDEEAGQPAAVCSRPNTGTLTTVPDRHEQDPMRICGDCVALLQEILAHPQVQGRKVQGITVTGQMHGVLLIDHALRPVTPLITWRDRRTQTDSSASVIRKLLGASAPLRLGCMPSPGYGGLTLHWLAQQGAIPHGATVLSIADFLTAFFSGVPVTDPTHAASWGIYDVTTGQWDVAALQALAIPSEVLPPVLPSSTPVGTLYDNAQELLPGVGNAVVMAPLGDNQASVIGAAGFATDTLVCNIGTGGQISFPLPAFRYHDGLETRPMPFDGFIQVGASLCGGWSYSYLHHFFREVLETFNGNVPDDDEIYTRMNELAVKSGAAGLAVDPRFSGTRAHPGVTGAITGINTTNLAPGALCRAMVDGIARELYQLWSVQETPGIQRMVASGNAPRHNPMLCTVLAEIFKMPCSLSPVMEEAALGAAQAAVIGLIIE